MKLLQNPWVVGAMALTGIGVLAFNVGGPLYKKYARNRPSAPKAAASVPVTAAAPAPVSPGAPVPSDLDHAHFTARMRDWVQTPPTDPFTPPPPPRPDAPKGPTAASVLKLQGTWRQTGSMVAVINRQAVIAGEMVDGFAVQRIEADRVLVVGPRGVEEIRFAGDPGSTASATDLSALEQASLSKP